MKSDSYSVYYIYMNVIECIYHIIILFHIVFLLLLFTQIGMVTCRFSGAAM